MDEAHREHEALQRLCAHFGIAADYHDIFGHRHVIDPDNLRALLRSFDVDTAAPLSHSIDAIHASAWRRMLPPALAIDAQAPHWSVRLHLPAALAEAHWSLEEEGGARHQGRIDLHALPELARTELDGVAYCERRVELALPLPMGYHRLRLAGQADEMLVISAPPHCWRPPALQDDGRIWGPALQLYALRSGRNWGIGDFGDLARLVQQTAAQGAGLIGLNPLHALFPHNPTHASPYSPSSRLQLDVLYIDVEAVDGFTDCEAARQRVQSPAFQARLAALRAAELVDYAGVAAAKFEILELLYRHFQARRDPAAQQAFEAFRAERGAALQRHALFEALQAHFHEANASIWGWPAWPAAYRSPDSPEVARFAATHGERIGWFAYLQWQAAKQLAAVDAQCAASGMAVGLYLDLAVSVDRAGSDAWCEQSMFALGASVGAPPDEFNPNGQGWGLPPLRPDRLRETGYRFFIDTLRGSMRGAGALRIDHVMGLMRLFWIPPDKTPQDGAYVHYALHEMLAIVAIESQRQHCMVIGEDLGTVADEMRGALARYEVLSYRLLYFERNHAGDFKAPAEYPRHALVAISTHDLATLAGWWAGHDLRLRLSLGLFPSQDIFEKQLLDRAQERVRLLIAVQHAGLLEADAVAEATVAPTLPPAVVAAIHAYLASTPSQVMMVQLEDAVGQLEQANMPGTTDSHPNWRRKLALDLAQLAADPPTLRLYQTLAAIRPHPE